MGVDITRESDGIRLTNGTVELRVATGFGPRITWFSEPGGDNVLAELGDLGIDLPDGRTYLLRGGHRLWAAPEVPEVTYEPDNDPVLVTESPSQLKLQQSASETVGIEKMIGVSLQDDSAVLTHTLTNRAIHPLQVAPWAITQLGVGGTAIIPLRQDLADPHGYQPNVAIAIWPYSGVNDNPFLMHDRLLLVDGNRTTPTKIGTSLDRGWLAYSRNGLVFVKRSQHVDGGTYVDLDASAQCYAGADFVELETLGQFTSLEAGASVTHIESWELHRIDPTTPPQDIPSLLDLDGGTTP